MGQFSKFCLCQQLFAFKDFCMETRLRNISKTRNDTDFNKTILESLYKVLLVTCNLTALKRPIFLLTTLEFWGTNSVSTIITSFVTCPKLGNYIFTNCTKMSQNVTRIKFAPQPSGK